MESICNPRKQFSNAVQELRNANADLVSDITIGISDGLVVPFVITAGLGGFLNAGHLIITSCLLEIATVCIYMRLGRSPAKNRNTKSAGTTALAYLLGGFVPLFPCIIYKDYNTGIRVSCFLTLLAFIAFGYFKSKLMLQPNKHSGDGRPQKP